MRGVAAPGALFLAALLMALPASARVLLEDSGVQVSSGDDLACGSPVDVEISADQPDLFASGSPRLQGLLDATRAMLGFECRNIPEIRVTGRLRGLSQISYAGTASAATRWRLEATRAVRAAPAAPASPSWAAPAPVTAPRYSIRDLTTGMSVDAATQQARTSFDAAPSYDSRRRELSVVRGGCEVGPGTRPKPGWVCMKAMFTDGRDPRAYRLSYVQTVDRDQAGAIAEQLRQRFGAPAVDEEQRSENWLRGGEPERHLAWGAQMPGPEGQPPRRELEARVRVEGGTTVLVLDLQDATLVASAPRFQVRF